MIQAIDGRGLITVQGPLPTGWNRIVGAAEPTFEGPAAGDGIAARLRVIVEPGTEGIETASLGLMREIQLTRPGALVVNCELWPHPQWGDGRYIQSAYLEGDVTLAHDIYLFLHAGRAIRVEVECALMQLLSIEEAVATIVARLRGREGAA